jgi:hypothetical protein
MMTPTLIVLALLALGVGIVVWATRRKSSAPPAAGPHDTDTAWNDPVAPAADARDGRTADEVPPAPEPRP